MRQITALLALLMVVACLAAPRDSSRVEAVGVAFYNLENLFDTINTNGKWDVEFSPQGSRKWDTQKYYAKISKLAYTISQFTTESTPGGPAIVGIAEVENENVVRDLVSASPLDSMGLKYVHFDSPDKRGIDVALLYNPAQFEPENVTNTPLALEEYPDLLTRTQMCVTGKLLGQPVAVIVNHWPSRLGGREESSPLREAAASLCKHIADSLWKLNPRMGVIIMGDLNDDPSDKSCVKVLGAASSPHGVKAHGFYNPFWRILDRGKGTLSYRGEWNLFDQIIISGNLVNAAPGRLRFRQAMVNDFDFLKNTDPRWRGTPLRTYASGKWLDGYSDHFPTEIILSR